MSDVKQFSLVKETWVKIESEIIMESDQERELVLESFKRTMNHVQETYGNGSRDTRIEYKVKEE